MLSLGGCLPLATVNRILIPSDGFALEPGITYGAEPRQKLDVYAPVTPQAARPVVVFFYGGSWQSGSRTHYRFIGEALTAHGVVTVVVDHRLYPNVVFPAFVGDAAQAVAWVHGHIASFGGDPGRIFLMGHSSGAHIAALLATDRTYLHYAGVPPASVRGLIGLAGPYAFDPFRYRTTRPIFAGLATPAPMQPLSFVAGDEAPMLLLHGSRDETVYPANSHALAAAVRSAGGTAEVVEYDVGHIELVLTLVRPLKSRTGVLDRIAAFIAEH
jgi:acetyl esterase/lipase